MRALGAQGAHVWIVRVLTGGATASDAKLSFRAGNNMHERQTGPVLKRSLGATEVVDRRTLSEAGAPLASERWAGAVDSVGSRTLANVLAQTRYRGVVTALRERIFPSPSCPSSCAT